MAALIIAEKPEPKKGKILVEVPEGLDLEGKKPGDTLEVVSEFEIEKDGKLCLKSINGIELPDYKEQEAEETKSPANFAEAVGGADEDY